MAYYKIDDDDGNFYSLQREQLLRQLDNMFGNKMRSDFGTRFGLSLFCLQLDSSAFRLLLFLLTYNICIVF